MKTERERRWFIHSWWYSAGGHYYATRSGCTDRVRLCRARGPCTCHDKRPRLYWFQPHPVHWLKAINTESKAISLPSTICGPTPPACSPAVTMGHDIVLRPSFISSTLLGYISTFTWAFVIWDHLPRHRSIGRNFYFFCLQSNNKMLFQAWCCWVSDGCSFV